MLSLFLAAAEADFVARKALGRGSIWIRGGSTAAREGVLAALVASVGEQLSVGALAEGQGEHPCLRGHRRKITLRVSQEMLEGLRARGTSYGALMSRQMINVALAAEPSELAWPAVLDVSEELPLWLAADRIPPFEVPSYSCLRDAGAGFDLVLELTDDRISHLHVRC